MLHLDGAALSRSSAHLGSNTQLARLFSKLENGAPITLGVVGASVAQNAGCLDQPRRRCMHFSGQRETLMSWGSPRKRAFKGFAVRMMDHINATWPHPDHRINNSAVDKTPVSGMLTCLMTNLPATLDLVIVEFNSMARWTKLPGIEGLVRLIASLPSRPALVVVSVHSWCRANMVVKVEAEAERVCRHYGIACLSQRRAFEPMVQAGSLTKEQLVGKDCIHPINGPLGVDSVTAMLTHWFDTMRQRHARTGARAGAKQPHLELPAPLWPENGETARGMRGQVCLAFGTPDERWSVRTMGEQLRPVRWRSTWCAPRRRPWLFDSDTMRRDPARLTSPCLAKPFEPSASATVDASRRPASSYAKALACPERIVRDGGQEYAAFFHDLPRGFFYCLLELKTNGQGTRKESFGVVAMVPGATLHFDGTASSAPPFVVTLAYLTSYRGMGIAAFNCVGVCECGEQIIDAHDASGSNATIFATISVKVSRRRELIGAGRAPCGMQLQVLNRTSSGGFKFKVRHLLIANERS